MPIHPYNKQYIIRYINTNLKIRLAIQNENKLYFILVFIYTSIKVKSKRGRKKNFDKQTIFSFGQHLYNTLHHLQPWRNNQRNNREHHHRQNAMQYIPYFSLIHLKSALQKWFCTKFFSCFHNPKKCTNFVLVQRRKRSAKRTFLPFYL